MSKLAALAVLAVTLAAGRALADNPPYAGSQDDTSYPVHAGRAAFEAGGAGWFAPGTPSDDSAFPLPAPGRPARALVPHRTFVAGNPSDDTTYPATAPAAASTPAHPGIMAGSPGEAPALAGPSR